MVTNTYPECNKPERKVTNDFEEVNTDKPNIWRGNVKFWLRSTNFSNHPGINRTIINPTLMSRQSTYNKRQSIYNKDRAPTKNRCRNSKESRIYSLFKISARDIQHSIQSICSSRLNIRC